MAKKNTLKQVPYAHWFEYDRTINNNVRRGWEMQEYPLNYRTSYGGGTGNGFEWRPNDVFTAQLTLVDMERGRSAARFIWVDEATKTRYPMFMSSALELLQNITLTEGVTSADCRWIAVKRGQNYGIELYVE